MLKKTKWVNLINRPIETLAFFIQATTLYQTLTHTQTLGSPTARHLSPRSLRVLPLEFCEIYKIEIMFSLKSEKRFPVSHLACSSKNWHYLKLRTHLHTRRRELKINTERYDAELPIIVKFCEPIKLVCVIKWLRVKLGNNFTRVLSKFY